MSETALKFGPEWLRNLSHGNNVTSPPPSPASHKYKLAEYRYGREEMLALFTKDLAMPDLSEFSSLAVEKCQEPLAFISMTEEEQRSWSRCVNSDIVLRLTGKGNGGGGGNATGAARGAGVGGRGGSVDRGRGRGRGSYYQRGLSFDDEDGPFARPRPMERSQSMSERDQRWEDRERRFDRPYAGRSGTEESNGVPRKEGSRIPLDNWRRHRDQGDEGGWRTRASDKWVGRGSWRNQSDREKNGDETDRGPHMSNHGDSSANGSVKISNHHSNRKVLCGWEDENETHNDLLPEWSTEYDDADNVGTFDASGAFMETKDPKNFLVEEEDDDDSEKRNNEEKDLEVEHESVRQTTKSNKSIEEQKSKTETNCVQPVDKCRTEVSNEAGLKEGQNVDNNKSFVNSTSNKDHIVVHEKKVSPESELTQKRDKSVSVTIVEEIPLNPTLQRLPINCSSKQCVEEVKQKKVQAPPATEVRSQLTEEDNFAHLEKATENMVAEWTAEEEQRVSSQMVDKTAVLPVHHEDAHKWFYRDPQGEVQGPFTPSEMLDWFTAGYFTMVLMVRRGCDERFEQLGELIKTWGKVPFHCNTNPPPPLRVNSLPNPITTSLTQANVPPPALQQQPNKDTLLQNRLIQQQLMQQQAMIAQQQLIMRQHTQIQQLINQLKQEESFTNLPPQEQQLVIMQHLIAQQQLQRPPSTTAMGEPQNVLESLSHGQFPPLIGLSIPQMLKNDGRSLWGPPPTGFPGSWPPNTTSTNQSVTGSIWDIEPHQTRSLEELERERERKKKEKEEEARIKAEEKRRLLEEQTRAEEEEKKRREEEKRRQEEEERKRQEEFRKQEEERRQEELRKQQEEERKRREEELRRQEELRKQEELQKQEELRKKKEQEERELEHQKQIEMERRKDMELEMKREEERKKELQKQRHQEVIRKLQEQQAAKSQVPAWGCQTTGGQRSALSLSEIQKLQEENEKQERDERRLQQLQLQHIQNLQQAQQSKGALTWALRSNDPNSPVKSLLEIQQEEAQRLVRQQQQQKQQQQNLNLNLGNAGVWGNASNHLIRSASSSPWNVNDANNSIVTGFWDDAIIATENCRNTKSNDSAFPSLRNLVQPVNETSNKAKIVRAKKEQENLMKLFETHTKNNTDKFTQWCIDVLSNLPSSVDVPTFVSFLKDIESPYEVHDYVRSYLGESKETREFAKQFLERRSKFRNQSKQIEGEENMWGPAPALTPSVNKVSSQHELDYGIGGAKGKKKKKNKMQKVDNSMLGFTVQPDSERLNVGEIDHIEGI